VAVITPDTFKPLRRYVGVRLQQGVPIVDADWNELEDVRRFEIRAYLKWFVGDGVPEGPTPDAFRIVGTGTANDFTIRSGVSAPVDGLRHIGRCLVDGLDVMIDADVTYRAQPLHDSQAGAPALRLKFGITRQVPELTAPAAPTTSTVYLDVWEWLVSATVDPTLVHPGLGTESCVRLAREWVVRVRDGLSEPVPGNADYDAGHSYYALARVTRLPGGGVIPANGVVDRRERRLQMPPATLSEDLLGIPAAEYRRGIGRPPISLRDAINALLRGEVPATPEMAILANPGANDLISRGNFFDGTGGLVTVWASDRGLPSLQVFAARLDLANSAAGFAAPPVQATSGGTAHWRPSAVLLPNGEILTVFETTTAIPSVELKHGTLAAGPTQLSAAPTVSVAAPATGARFPFAVLTGTQVVVLWYEAPNIRFDRFDTGTGVMAGAPTPLGNPVANVSTPINNPGVPPNMHAVRDAGGTVWVAFQNTTNQIQTDQITAGPMPPSTVHTVVNNSNATPFLVADQNDDVWLFWTTLAPIGQPSIMHRRFIRSTGAWDPAGPTMVPGTDVGSTNGTPAAAVDGDGAVWLFWSSNRIVPSNAEIWFVRRHPVTGTWSDPRQLTGAVPSDLLPFPLAASDGALWLLWQRQLAGLGELFFRRLITKV
jgi:hypothetical protein